MSLGDRIAIVNEGHIVQIGTGDEIYYMPCNEFVAQLMGDPEINNLHRQSVRCNHTKLQFTHLPNNNRLVTNTLIAVYSTLQIAFLGFKRILD